MIYGSVCSGVEAATLAWEPLGWKAGWFSEIEAFPSAVLAHHWPDVPNLGDMTTIRENEYARRTNVDVLVGGTPCQSFSVAGLRGGLDDDRGNLALEYCRLADALRPRWVVWENVPGVLSSNGGRDFGSILGALGECGYGVAWRVLDAQYFGVPQRRRRVFVVGYLGDWRRAAAVLFEPESMFRHPAPRREPGEDTAPTIAARTNGGGGLGTDFDLDGGLILSNGEGSDGATLTAANLSKTVNNQTPLVFKPSHYTRGKDGAPTIITGGRDGPKAQTGPREALRVLLKINGQEAVQKWCLGIIASFWPKEVLRARLHGKSLRCSTQPKFGPLNCTLSRQKDGAAWTMRAVWQAGCVGCPPQRWESHQQPAKELGAYLSKLPYAPSPAETFMQDMWQASKGARLLRETLSAVQDARRSEIGKGQSARRGAVRRLTVEECEALQGMPRGHTLIEYKGKPAKDSPRYKAIGNSMAVPVMRWIGERIALADKINA